MTKKAIVQKFMESVSWRFTGIDENNEMVFRHKINNCFAMLGDATFFFHRGDMDSRISLHFELIDYIILGKGSHAIEIGLTTEKSFIFV